jgi:hypothetical protein
LISMKIPAIAQANRFAPEADLTSSLMQRPTVSFVSRTNRYLRFETHPQAKRVMAHE